MINETTHLSPYVIHGALALFGALVHALDAHRKGESKSIVDFISLIIMSSFSGVMFALLGFEWFGSDSYLTLALAGTGGFIGVEGMTFIRNYILSKYKNK